MVQNLIAALSTLIALAGLAVSYLGHRDKVRREDELARLRQELEKEAEQQGVQAQASKLDVHVDVGRSQLHNGWAVPKLVVENQSNQPVHDLVVSFHDKVVAEMPLLDTGDTAFPLPLSEGSTPAGLLLRHVTVDFTDAAGIRWRREGRGSLRSGSGNEALGTWQWGRPEQSRIEPAAPSESPALPSPVPPAGPPGELPWFRRVSPVLVAVLSVVVLIIVSRWWWALLFGA
jgi:hypothetical protein